MVERAENEPLPYQKIIEGVDGNLVKAFCPEHNAETYFERIEGNLFQCAQIDHYEDVSRQTLSNLPPKRIDR